MPGDVATEPIPARGRPDPVDLNAYHAARAPHRTRAEIADEYYHRPDKAANILAPVETQCAWLRAIGFVDVDCFFKLFELAVFGGRKPM